MAMTVIDSDGHVRDDADLLQPFLPEAFRGRPLFARDEWHRHLPGTRGANPRTPQDQLAAMDREGVDVAVLYPTSGLGIGVLREPEKAVAIAHAYNDWLADFCTAAPERLKGVAIVAPHDPLAAARELNRAVTDLGFVGLMMPTWVPGRYLSDQAFDPIYAEAATLGVPIGTHTGVGQEAMPPRFPDFLSTHATAHPFEQMAAVCSFVVGGILERHPALRVAFLESGIGWVPFWLERLDESFEKRHAEVPYLRMKPSEYLLSGRCYFHTEPEEKGLVYAIEVLGDDQIMYASDYPHWDCMHPDSARILQERTDLSESSKRKILGDNAARFYKLPVPAGV